METWTTKDGKRILFKDMETSHIKNCIAMLNREMPSFEDDECLCGDHWSLGVATIPGAKSFRNTISKLERELLNRI